MWTGPNQVVQRIAARVFYQPRRRYISKQRLQSSPVPIEQSIGRILDLTLAWSKQILAVFVRNFSPIWRAKENIKGNLPAFWHIACFRQHAIDRHAEWEVY